MPEEKSISRFESSRSVDWRLMITGLERLNSSATCWASLKLLGVTTGMGATPPPVPPAARRRPRPRAGRAAPATPAARLRLLGRVVNGADAAAPRRRLVVAEDVVDVLLAASAA